MKVKRKLLPQTSAASFPDVFYGQGGHKQQLSDMERIFSRYFGNFVSEWNLCFDEHGNVRYLWDEDVGAHDVEVDDLRAVNPSCPERASLRYVLDAVFDPNEEKPDLDPVRRLVAALVESSGRHKLHERSPPVIGKHPCARGTPECPKCRYGFPLPHVARGGRRPMRLDKGDKLGSWYARSPRNDQICCNYEPHQLLDNLGNIDWRPCMNLWLSLIHI